MTDVKRPAGQKSPPPFLRCEWDLPTAAAVQALSAGTATPEQQKDFLNWLVNQACATYDISFQLEGDRETAFAEGRRFVGTQVVKLLKLSLNVFRKAKQNG